MWKVTLSVLCYVVSCVSSNTNGWSDNLPRLDSNANNASKGDALNQVDRNLRIESVMLRHTATWDRFPGESSFTVKFKVTTDSSWFASLSCGVTHQTRCDVSMDLRNAMLTYYVTVVSDVRPQISDVITFRPELDTTLLPPMFTAFRHKEVIFIRPAVPMNLGTGDLIIDQLTTLKYQVHYWTTTEPKLTSNMSVLIHDTQIASPPLDPLREFCFHIRLYEPEYAMINATAGSSAWSNVTCFKGQHSSRLMKLHNKVAIYGVAASLGCILVVFVLVYGSYRARKTYRSMHKVGEVPNNLMTVLSEMEAMTVDRYHIWAPNTEMFDVVSLKPIGGTGSGCLDENSEVFLDAKERIVCGYGERTRDDIHRKRIRSRGYHSASSDSTETSEIQEYVQCNARLPSVTQVGALQRWPREVNEYLPETRESGLPIQTKMTPIPSYVATAEDVLPAVPNSFLHTVHGETRFMVQPVCFRPLASGVETTTFPVDNPTYSSDITRSTPDLFHREAGMSG